tara:strand:+ start:3479 stop:3679 length:201 start_codon:yes stop_codon:yes gene_type:complete
MTTTTLKKSDTIYRTPTEDILTQGLRQMTKACDAITKQNEILNSDINNLKSKLTQAKEKLLVNGIE